MKLDLITSLYVFMLAAFIGFEVIRRVSPLLHTPLMSLTNALDAIAVVGAIILAGEHKSQLAAILGTIAIVAAPATSSAASSSPIACCACSNPAGPRDHNAHRHADRNHLSRRTVLFILSLKWLSSPTTARHGVWAGEIGMALAIGGTLLYRGIVDYKLVAIGLVLGCIIGVPLGKVQMTAVPQRTALSHAFGALCVTLVGTSEFYLRAPNIPPFMMAVLSMEVILGSLTFTGSLMAAGKLQEILPQRPITYKGQNFVNLGMLALAVAVAAMLVIHPEQIKLFPAMILIPLIFGVMLVIPSAARTCPR